MTILSKIKLIKELAAAMCLVFIAAVNVSASEEAAHSSGASHWFWMIVNFAVFLSVIIFFLKKPLSEYFANRTRMIEQTLEEAKETKILAQKALDEIEKQLKMKDSEIERIIHIAKTSGEAERDKLIENAKRMAEKIKEITEQNIDFEKRRAISDIKKSAVESAMEMAENSIKENISPKIKDKLFDDAILQIGGKN
ncbi:ATP synthase F0 subunit B [Candidatus Magnetomonas plexicatena]|uniref:ATP synthase F0 subunit B n=1 Tax=Candidatus Magnetomonas plexicatena TaxID=2552947 RepID=UPI001C742C33|nr:ATP synthase F0 subunit B [Nitrospirales bacterium LBB_01]